MKQSTLDKMNETLVLSLVSDEAWTKNAECFKQIAKFTAAHSTVESKKFHAYTREEILQLFIEDTHTQIFKEK